MGSGAIVLDMWDGIGASDDEILTAILNQCVEANPDITVKRRIMPWNVCFDKLAAAIVAGSGAHPLILPDQRRSCRKSYGRVESRRCCFRVRGR